MFYTVMKYVIMILFVGMLVGFIVVSETETTEQPQQQMQQSGPKFNF